MTLFPTTNPMLMHTMDLGARNISNTRLRRARDVKSQHRLGFANSRSIVVAVTLLVALVAVSKN
jgi:hypothetical protein